MFALFVHQYREAICFAEWECEYLEWYRYAPSCHEMEIRPLYASTWNRCSFGCHFDETAFVFGSHRDSVFLVSWECSETESISLDAISVTLRFWPMLLWESAFSMRGLNIGLLMKIPTENLDQDVHEWAVDYCNYGFNVSCDFQLPPLRLCAATVLRGRLQFLGLVAWPIAKWWKMRSEHLQLLVGTFQCWCSHVVVVLEETETHETQ